MCDWKGKDLAKFWLKDWIFGLFIAFEIHMLLPFIFSCIESTRIKMASITHFYSDKIKMLMYEFNYLRWTAVWFFFFLVDSVLDFFCSVEMEHCMTTQVLLVLVRVMVQVLVMKQIVMHMMMMMMMEDGWTWTCHGFIWELELDLLLAFSELLGWLCLSTLPGSSISIGGFACMGLDSQGYSNLRPNRLVRVFFFSFFFNYNKFCASIWNSSCYYVSDNNY